jgi:hypothetical protein
LRVCGQKNSESDTTGRGNAGNIGGLRGLRGSLFLDRTVSMGPPGPCQQHQANATDGGPEERAQTPS